MKKLIAIPIIAGIAVIAAYYASPLFINTAVDEPLPTRMQENDVMEKQTTQDAMQKEPTSAMKDKEVEPKIVLTGSFAGAGDGIHNAEGISKVLAVSDDKTEHRILRFEDFKSTNGPDLYVYLSKDARSISDGYIDLGRLKGNIGNQNYHISDDVNLDEYKYALIWCKQFSVLFGYAELQSA